METTTESAITGGVATIFVSDMDRAVRFYHEILGLNLVFRAGNEWASIDAGKGFMIGLHPIRDGWKPVTAEGGTQVGLNVTGPIERLVAGLKTKGVEFQGDIKDDAEGGVKLAFFKDPDGNELYLCESKWG